MTRYVALLRGINVGGNKKVPMPQLKKVMQDLGYAEVKTLLATGNIVFDAENASADHLAAELEKAFGFAIPTILLTHRQLQELVDSRPFASVTVTDRMHLYVTFLPKPTPAPFALPYLSEDGSLQILQVTDEAVLSVLDLTIAGTVDAYLVWEKAFGKQITTRNYNTVVKLCAL
ncbi:MAG: DUF1697 domain-containing protein [Bacteroidetes bacterium]|nr:DUF1697 domain-containing protein [Bacteroidota bacterium]